ncbi:MAG TPA: nucleotide sugar dehydrogenase [Dongiaceae bacterium]
MKATVIGLGKLGSPMAACLAARGLQVIGVDADPRKVEAINQGKPPVLEPGLAEMLAQSQGRLTAVSGIEEAVRDSEASFIVVATPSEPAGGFSLRYVEPVCQAIGRALAKRKDYHLVTLTSTVMPGATGNQLRAILEKASGKRCGADFGLCYSPEFIALGSVIRDFLNPDMVLIGESDSRAGDLLESIYRQVCENKPAAARMSFVNAEITKLAVNSYITTKISFANMLARISERSPGANVDVITAALGLDSRIGPKYLKGAVSYGGPCFPRDNLAMGELARRLGVSEELPRTVDRFNRSQIAWLTEQVSARSGGRIAILGLSYKPGTDVVEEAAGFLLAEALAKRGLPVSAYDPGYVAGSSAGSEGGLPAGVTRARSAEACIDDADLVVLATPWPEFARMPAERWARPTSPRIVIDCWRVLGSLRDVPGIAYLALGLGEGFA